MSGNIRRVVTGQAPGRPARVVSDGLVPNVHRFGEGGAVVVDIWKTFSTPSKLGAGHEEPAGGPMSLIPPQGGHVFRISEMPPDPPGGTDPAAAAALFAQMGAAQASTHGSSDAGRGGLMHRTESLDYGIVLEGEITLVLDMEEVLLQAGDVVIQRGSNHGWSNRSGKMCRMAFFMSAASFPDT
jgi:hypothetical protein